MHTKVVKFGGTSLADAGQFKKVADIILSDKSRRFVVPSAPGKRYSDDIKVTDMLYACYEKASKGEDFSAAFDAIKERYMSIINELGLDISLEDEFAKIKQGFIGKAGRDYAASRGEYLSGIVLSKLLGFNFVDPANYIFFNEQGIFDMEKTNQALGEKLAKLPNAVIPGFYGSMPNDTIRPFQGAARI